jgi:hypothetical protein
MSGKLFGVLSVLAALAIGFAVQPVIAHRADNAFEDHWLVAGCNQATNNGQVWNTSAGPAVGHQRGETGDLVIYCNIEADDFHNELQFHAEDNTASGSIRVTVYQQPIESRGERIVLATLTSTDQPGVQQTSVFLDTALEFNEFNDMYYVEIVVTKTNPRHRLMIYDVSLRDAL